ncbi:MAG: hypothetical protein KQJ78_23980 [Deltaproteobacteria bacterium]|nr:hypothetical protein [Deltaproteobacteria bacterium]
MGDLRSSPQTHPSPRAMKTHRISMTAGNAAMVRRGLKTQTRRVGKDWEKIISVGDRLLVGEMLRRGLDGYAHYRYDDSLVLVGGKPWPWFWKHPNLPAIFCPTPCVRTICEITVPVRVERLGDISEADCEAEGIYQSLFDPEPGYSWRNGVAWPTRRAAYADLWDSVVKDKPGRRRKDNPEVRVITFRFLGPQP